MAQPIYSMFMGRFIEAWYQLSEKEQNKLLDKIEAINKKLGVERIIVCESGWSNDEWQFFGVEKFPSAEVKQEHYKLLDEMQWFRYIESKVLLGTAWRRD